MRWASRQSGVILLVIFILVVMAVGAVIASEHVTEGEPGLEIYLPDDEVLPGERTTLELQIQNNGTLDSGNDKDVVGTAESVTVSYNETGPFTPRSNTTALGTVRHGQALDVGKQLAVPDDVEPGTYRISFDVNYTHTESVTADGQQSQASKSVTRSVYVSVPDEPRFSLRAPAGTVEPGASGETTIEVENTGAAPANATDVELAGTGAVTVGEGSDRTSLGDIDPGETKNVSVDVTIAEGASGGEKVIEGLFTYEDRDGVEHVSDTVRGSLLTAAEVTTSVEDISHELVVGFDGTISGEVTNEGPGFLEDGVVVIDTGTESLAIQDPRYALPDLESGDSAEFSFPVTVSEAADPGDRQVEIRVEHRGGDRSTLTTDPARERVSIGEKQRFEIADVEGNLEVGYHGEMTGVIENRGPRTIDDGVLVVEPRSDSLFVEDTRYALPTLEPGEETRFRYPTDVSGQADEGPRQVTFTVEYEGGEGRTVTSDTMSTRVEVAPRSHEFDIRPVDATLEQGETRVLTFEIENQRPETLSEIDARAYTNDPLFAPGDEDFIPELAPGETIEISFEIGAGGDARERTYRIDMDFEYQDAGGETQLSDLSRVGIEIVEPTDDDPTLLDRMGGPTVLGVVVLAFFAIALTVWYRRRD